MRNDFYPSGSVRMLLQTDEVNPQTKEVLVERLQEKKRIQDQIFSDQEFYLLDGVCDRLFPQGGRSEKIDLAILLEEQLRTGKGRGWRIMEQPALKDGISLLLHQVKVLSLNIYNNSFLLLTNFQKDDVIRHIQNGNINEGIPDRVLPGIFSELMATLAELYYSHPIAKEEIGEVAFADVTGWNKMGLDRLEDREPKPVGNKKMTRRK